MKLFFSFALCTVLLFPPCIAVAQDIITALSYDAVYTQLTALSVDDKHVAEVHEKTLVRDAATFHLENGFLCLLSPVGGRVVGALFWGDGEVTVVPPTHIEREQLQRAYNDSTLHRNITSVFFIFTDSTLDELKSNLTFVPKLVERAEQNLVDQGVAYLSYESAAYFDSDIMEQMLNQRTGGLFHAQFDIKNEKPFFFRINPGDDDREAVSLQRSISVEMHRKEVLCKFRRSVDVDNAPSQSDDEDRSTFSINRYAIDVSFQSDLAFSASSSVEIQAVSPCQSWVRFTLMSRLAVDSVLWDSVHPAEFFKGLNNQYLWVRFDRPLESGHTRTCRFVYHGDLIRKYGKWIYIASSVQWYPQHGSRHKALFDLTFHVPAAYSLVSVGDSLPSVVNDGMVTTKWRTAEPIRNASFNVGMFSRIDIGDTAVVPVTMLIGEYTHSGLGPDMNKHVGDDVVKSLSFFQHVYGKLPISHFYASEIPGWHGEAFPGLIHLAWITFQQEGSHGDMEIFRAHEVAHQWWGIGVDFKSYHDQWISEGIANFSGLWYMQAVQHNNAKYFDQLARWKKSIAENRIFLLKNGQKAGPIWMGYRTQSSTTRGDYNLVVYEKGAWVMHMLRNMFIDIKSMNEDVFIGMMRDAQETYLGKKMSTENFRAVVERHAGKDMGWFFNQWIYGTELPTYQCAYKAEKTSADKYVVHCRITQQNVAPSFQMPMIVKVDFGDNRFARMRINVTGPVTQIDLPLMPMAPKNIVFNDLESVLCTVENVDW